jgi:gas vesicle protein
MLGGGIAGGLMGAGIGAAAGGLHGYFTAPDEVDPATGQMKSKWGNVWPSMGMGAALGGAAGGAAGMHAGFGEKARAWDWFKKVNPEEAMKYKYYHMPENFPDQMEGYQKATGRIP